MSSSRIILLATLALLVSLSTSASAQLRRPAPPKIEPGALVDVNDWGGIKLAEYIETTKFGRIKVRMEDGEEKEFFAHDVRPSKTKRKKKPAAASAGGGGLSGPRTWSDASGKFKIDASFVALNGEKVELKKADGNTVQVPLDKLSSADQDIARALASGGGSSAAADPENPFEAGSTGTTSTATSSSPAAVAPVPSIPTDLRRGDASAAKKIELVASEDRFPAIAAAPEAKFTSKGIALPMIRTDPHKNFELHRRIMTEMPGEYLFVDPYRNHLWAPIEPISAHEEGPVRVERLDLATGKSLGSLVFPPIKRILDVDSSGKLVAAFGSHSIHESPDKVDLFRVAGSKVNRVMRFQPNGGSGNVVWADIIGTAHLLTKSNYGTTVLWKLPEMSAVYAIEPGASTAIPAVSADEKVMALTSANGVFLLDVLTGDVLVHIDTPLNQSASGRLVFNPAGTRLALANSGGVRVFDTATGELVMHSKAPMTYFEPLGPTGFATDRYLLSNDSLIDLEVGLVLCKYEFPRFQPHTIHGGRLWCLLTNREDAMNIQRGLVHFEIPQPEAIEKAKGITRESLLAVKPGDKVGIQLNVSFTPEETQKIKDAYIKAIQKNGWLYSDESPVAVLTAEVTSQSKEEVFRSTFGKTQNVTLTDYIGRGQLKKGDRVLWETSRSWAAPRVVFAKEGEAAAELNKHKPTIDFFLAVEPAKEVVVYPDAGGICKATVDASGVKTE